MVARRVSNGPQHAQQFETLFPKGITVGATTYNTIGDMLAAKAQEYASGWVNQDQDTRYGNYRPAIQKVLDRINEFLRDAGLPDLTLDGVDRGTQQMTMPNPPKGFTDLVAQYYRQRGWYMGIYVHDKTGQNFRDYPVAALTYSTIGPDFRYQEKVSDPLTYFELLTNTKYSREKHDERHGTSLWRAVFYTFSATGPDVSDIE